MKIKKMVALLSAFVLCMPFFNAVRVNAEAEVSAQAACLHPVIELMTVETSPEKYSHSHKVVTSVTSWGEPVYSMCDVYTSTTTITRQCTSCGEEFTDTKENKRHTLPWADNNPYNP